MADDALLKSMMIDTLNESTPPLNFTEETLDFSIQLAKIMVFTTTGEGAQRQLTATSNGTTRIPISDDIIRVIRLDSLGDACGLEQITVAEANQLNPAWRGCEYSGDEPTGYIIDPDTPDALWILPAPESGTVINFTAVSAENADQFPIKLLPAIRHLALAYAYERAYGNNANSVSHMEKGFQAMRILEQVAKENSRG